MTADPDLAERDTARRADLLLRGAAAAGRRAAKRLAWQAADFTADDAARLDDRIRALLSHLLHGIVGSIEAALRDDAARLLLARSDHRSAAKLRAGPHSAYDALTAHETLASEDLLGELIARVRHDLLAERLPPRAGDGDEPSLLVRLSEVSDLEVSRHARALLIAESRRAEALALGVVTGSELPAELHHKLVWLVAAALRNGDSGVDRALADAAGRLLAKYDEGERTEACATRLALAIDARAPELPALLDEALGDRRLSLVVAVLAHAAGLTFEQVRGFVVDPEDERWWLLLRAVDLDPLTIARIGLTLTEADPRRRADELPDLCAAANAVSAATAREALAEYRLPADFRLAVRALEKARAL